MPASPNTLNYYVGKGIVEFKKSGEVAFRHLGNVAEFEFTPEIEQLEHFSAMEGVASRDRTIVTRKSAAVRLLMDEWTPENLAMALLGDIEQDTFGRDVISIFSSNAISGELRFTGQNEVGPRYRIHLLKVDFIPGSSVNPISEEFGQLEINGEAAAVAGEFGTAVHLGEEGEENTGD